MKSASAAAGVVALALGVAAAGFVVIDNNTAVAEAPGDGEQREFISQQTLACPSVPAGSGRTGWTTAVAVPGVPGVSGPGVLRVGALGRKGRVAQTDSAGTTIVRPLSDSAASRVSAERGLAPGLVSASLSRDGGGEGKGIASSPCLAADSDIWLAGGGAGEGQRDTLELANPTTTAAIVDLSVYGRGGELEVRGTQGIVVPAGKVESVRLDALAPGVADAVVRVRTTVGIVTAAVIDDRMDGLTPRGTEIIPPAADPQSDIVTAPIPAGPGTRRLVLFAPGGAGTATLSAITPDGTVALLADTEISLKRRHVSGFDLTEELAGRAAALRISATTPVVAAVSAASDPDTEAALANAAAVQRAEQAIEDAKGAAQRRDAEAALAKAEKRDAIPPGEDLAWFAAASPLVGTGAVTGLRSDTQVRILLSAPEGDTSATVRVLPGAAEPADLLPGTDVEVKGGTTAQLRVAAPKGAEVFTVVVVPSGDSQPLVAGHVQRGEDGAITGYGIRALPAWVALPRAAPDYSSG